MPEATIDAKVEGSFLLKSIWNKGKYGLAVLGLAYVANAGYHLYQASENQIKFVGLQKEVEFAVLGLFHRADGWKEAGLSRDEQHQRWEAVMDDLKTKDKRAEVSGQRNYHLWRALNPFYK